MSISKKLNRTSAAALMGMASGLAVNVVNVASAHAATTDAANSNTTTSKSADGKTTTTTTTTITTTTSTDTGDNKAAGTTTDGKTTTTDNKTAGTTTDGKTTTTTDGKTAGTTTDGKTAGTTTDGKTTTDTSKDGASTSTGDTKSKVVTYVDEAGTTLGTGKITAATKDGKTTYSVDKTIPAGYKLKSNDDLKTYPDKLTLVKDDTSKDTSSATAEGDAATTDAGETQSKTVTYVDEAGNTLGTGTISMTKKGTQTIYSVDKTIPAGYALKNTTDLESYPDKLTLVKNASSTDTSSATIANETNADANGATSTDTDADANKDADADTDSDADKDADADEDADQDADEDADKDADKDSDSKNAKSGKSATPTTTTTTTGGTGSTGSGSSTSSSTLPSTGNLKTEKSMAIGAGLLLASLAAAGVSKKKRQ